MTVQRSALVRTPIERSWRLFLRMMSRPMEFRMFSLAGMVTRYSECGLERWMCSSAIS